jgi:hypothetical protein
MSAAVEKKNLNKKEEFKNYLLELLQEDYVFRQKVYQLLLDVMPSSQPLPRRSKEEWKALSAASSIEWSDMQAMQELFRETD